MNVTINIRNNEIKEFFRIEIDEANYNTHY